MIEIFRNNKYEVIQNAIIIDQSDGQILISIPTLYHMQVYSFDNAQFRINGIESRQVVGEHSNNNNITLRVLLKDDLNENI